MSHVDDGMMHGYLDGELSPAETRGIDAHVTECPDCRRRLEEERALIARASELLALATPPDRALPPFRAGDVKAPTRLWWQVRLPLAWAATVVLALGIGTYLGRVVKRASQAEAARDVGAATPRPTAEPAKRDLARRDTRVAARTAPAPARALTDSIAPRRSEVVLERAADEGSPWQKGGAISVDSARRVLGTEPHVVPGVPIEAVYQGRRIGYTNVVIVEQALDSTTTIEVINARTAPQRLDQVVVAGAPAARPEPAPAADSLAAPARRAAPFAAKAAGQGVPALFRDVRGPLSPDSLAALLRRLQPLRNATGP